MTETNLKETVRISFNVAPELHDRFQSCIPHGARARLLRKVLEIAVINIEKGGYAMIGAIMSGDFDPLFAREEEKDGSTN